MTSDRNEQIDAWFDGELSVAATVELEAWFRADQSRLETFVEAGLLHRGLRDAILTQSDTLMVMIPPAVPVSSPSPAPIFLSTAFPATLGYSSGWSVSYLLATVITGLLILGFWLMPVSRPEQVARQSDSLPSPLSPLPSVVGRITGLVDCKWEKKVAGGGWRVAGNPNQESEIKTQNSLVSLGDKFLLSSGLMEIAYDSGAKVILQGPVTYQVESNGGYLSVGKLTGKLEKNDECRMMNDELRAQMSDIHHSSFIIHPFSIHTPTATVTDLGTEFGVEVDRNGGTEAHVLTGAVKMVLAGGRDVESDGRVVRAGHAARFDGRAGGFIETEFKGPRFVRNIVADAGATRADRYGDLVLSMRPFAYYRMERPKAGADQTVVFDTAPGAHHGRLRSANEFYMGRRFYATGRAGSSLRLEDQQYVEVRNFPTSTTNQLSISAWVYCWLPQREGQIAAEAWGDDNKAPSRIATWQFLFGLWPSTGELWAVVKQRDGKQASVIDGSGKPLPDGQWQHVALVADGVTLRLYRNGVAMNSAPCGGLALTPPIKRFIIGGMPAIGAPAASDAVQNEGSWHGHIDELAIFYRALGPEEVQQLYKGQRSANVAQPLRNKANKEKP